MYTDETEEKSWYNRNLPACFHPQEKSGKFSVMVSYQFNLLCEFLDEGPILMVLHIISEDRLMQDGDYIDVAPSHRGKSSKRDYHKNTNLSRVEDYMVDKVLPKL